MIQRYISEGIDRDDNYDPNYHTYRLNKLRRACRLPEMPEEHDDPQGNPALFHELIDRLARASTDAPGREPDVESDYDSEAEMTRDKRARKYAKMRSYTELERDESEEERERIGKGKDDEVDDHESFGGGQDSDEG